MSGKKKKILIMLATGKSNLGDELILQEEVRFLRERYGNVEITVCTYNAKSNILRDKEGIRFISYFPNKILTRPFQNIWYFFHNIVSIYRSDIIIIGGGGIIFDNEPGVSFSNLLWQWRLRTKVARIAGNILLFWGISIEVGMVTNKLKLKTLFVPGDFIIVRDTRSKGLLEALEIPASIVDDIAFLYAGDIQKELRGVKKRVGISIRGGFMNDESEEAIPQIYDFLVSEGFEPVFLVFSTEGALEQNDSLYIKKVMAGRTYNVTKTIDQTLNVFPFLYASIGMRFHSGVLSCVHESPCVHISYSFKTSELINSLEAEHLMMNSNDVTLEKFQEMWHTLVKNYQKECSRLHERNTYIKETIRHKLETL